MAKSCRFISNIIRGGLISNTSNDIAEFVKKPIFMFAVDEIVRPKQLTAKLSKSKGQLFHLL